MNFSRDTQRNKREFYHRDSKLIVDSKRSRTRFSVTGKEIKSIVEPIRSLRKFIGLLGVPIIKKTAVAMLAVLFLYVAPMTPSLSKIPFVKSLVPLIEVLDVNTEDSSWQLLDILSPTPSGEGRLVLTAPDTKNLDGWVSLSSSTVSPGFTLHSSFKPMGIQANIVYQYGPVRIIIGDGGMSRIGVKNKGAYIKPNGYQIGHFNLHDSFKTGEKVDFRVHFSKPDDRGNIKVEFQSIEFTSTDGSRKLLTSDLPVFEVPADPSINLEGNTIGIGLIDPQRIGNVRAEFSKIEILKD